MTTGQEQSNTDAQETRTLVSKCLWLTASAAALMFVALSLTGSVAINAAALVLIASTISQALMHAGSAQVPSSAPTAHDQPTPQAQGGEGAFWSFGVGTMVFALAAGMTLMDALQAISNPRLVSNAGLGAIAIIAATALIGLGTIWLLSKVRVHDPEVAQAHETAEPVNPVLTTLLAGNISALASSCLALIALLATAAGLNIADGVIAALIGLILSAAAITVCVRLRSALIANA